jgi:hypothetical protein
MGVHSSSRARMTKSCAADDTNKAEQIYRIAEDATGSSQTSSQIANIPFHRPLPLIPRGNESNGTSLEERRRESEREETASARIRTTIRSHPDPMTESHTAVTAGDNSRHIRKESGEACAFTAGASLLGNP